MYMSGVCMLLLLPAEAMKHADALFPGPGEERWPRFLGILKME